MTANEQTILNAAQAINSFKAQLDTGIARLEDRIRELGVQEDLSEELQALQEAIGGISETAEHLNRAPAPAGTPAVGSTDATNDSPLAAPIDHAETAVVTPLAGSSGPTDAGVPTTVVPPGTAAPEDAPMTQPAEDAQVEANPNLPASDESVPAGVAAGDGVADSPVKGEEDPGTVEDDADVIEDDEEEDADPDADTDDQFDDD